MSSGDSTSKNIIRFYNVDQKRIIGFSYINGRANAIDNICKSGFLSMYFSTPKGNNLLEFENNKYSTVACAFNSIKYKKIFECHNMESERAYKLISDYEKSLLDKPINYYVLSIDPVYKNYSSIPVKINNKYTKKMLPIHFSGICLMINILIERYRNLVFQKVLMLTRGNFLLYHPADFFSENDKILSEYSDIPNLFGLLLMYVRDYYDKEKDNSYEYYNLLKNLSSGRPSDEFDIWKTTVNRYKSVTNTILIKYKEHKEYHEYISKKLHNNIGIRILLGLPYINEIKILHNTENDITYSITFEEPVNKEKLKSILEESTFTIHKDDLNIIECKFNKTSGEIIPTLPPGAFPPTTTLPQDPPPPILLDPNRTEETKALARSTMSTVHTRTADILGKLEISEHPKPIAAELPSQSSKHSDTTSSISPPPAPTHFQDPSAKPTTQDRDLARKAINNAYRKALLMPRKPEAPEHPKSTEPPESPLQISKPSDDQSKSPAKTGQKMGWKMKTPKLK